MGIELRVAMRTCIHMTVEISGSFSSVITWKTFTWTSAYGTWVTVKINIGLIWQNLEILNALILICWFQTHDSVSCQLCVRARDAWNVKGVVSQLIFLRNCFWNRKNQPFQVFKGMVRCPVGSFLIDISRPSAPSFNWSVSKSSLARKNSKKPTESSGGIAPSRTVISKMPVLPSNDTGTKTTCKALAAPPMPAGVTKGRSTLTVCRPTVFKFSVSSAEAVAPIRSWVAPVSSTASPRGSDRKAQASASPTELTTSRKSFAVRKVKAEWVMDPPSPQYRWTWQDRPSASSSGDNLQPSGPSCCTDGSGWFSWAAPCPRGGTRVVPGPGMPPDCPFGKDWPPSFTKEPRSFFILAL